MYKQLTDIDDSLLIDNEFDSFELDSRINHDIDSEDFNIYEIESPWPGPVNH